VKNPADTIEALRKPKGRKAAKKEAAKRKAEAARRWHELRSTVEDRAETWLDVAGDRAETWLDAAGDHVEHARDAAAPQVKRGYKKAVKAIDPVADRLRDEIDELSSAARDQVVRLAVDVKDATRGEADRIIEEIHRSAEEARAEERSGRVKALVGWTVFGMIAGALLAREIESRRQDVHALDVADVEAHRDQLAEDAVADEDDVLDGGRVAPPT
jgi:hypothetical protein